VFPSVADLIFLVLLLSLSVGTLATRLLGDADIGWHIRNGELILQTHTITRTDPFSSTMGGQPWYAWEWLYDVTIAAIHHIMGLNGVVLLTTILMAATFAFTLRSAVMRGGSLPVSVFLLLLAIAASTVHFLARPHVLSWLFTAAWFQCLDAVELSPGRWRRLLWLPVLMVAWVNLHGGFLMGFVLLAIYLMTASARWQVFRSENRNGAMRELRRLAGVAGLCFLASFCNPYGWRLHIHIYRYLSNRFLMNHIDEFLSPNFHGVAQQCFAVLLLVSLIALAVRRSPLRWSQLLVVLLSAYSGLYATRNLPVSSILMVLVIAPTLTQSLTGVAGEEKVQPWLRGILRRLVAFSARVDRIEAGSRAHTWALAGVIFMAWVALHGGRMGRSKAMDAHFDSKRFPVQALDVVTRTGFAGPVLCPDYWGGFLIYRLYPRVRVVLDDRHDLYGSDFFGEYLKLVRVEPGWERVLDEHEVRWLLLPSDSSLANVIRETRDWTVVYQDRTATMFKR